MNVLQMLDKVISLTVTNLDNLGSLAILSKVSDAPENEEGEFDEL